MAILVNGGAGYIGSHTCIELMKAGYEIIVADNLYNSCEEALRRVEQISGKKVPFVNVELCDGEAVDALRDNKDFNAFLVEKLRMRPVDYGADAARRYMEEASARYAEEAARP